MKSINKFFVEIKKNKRIAVIFLILIAIFYFVESRNFVYQGSLKSERDQYGRAYTYCKNEQEEVQSLACSQDELSIIKSYIEQSKLEPRYRNDFRTFYGYQQTQKLRVDKRPINEGNFKPEVTQILIIDDNDREVGSLNFDTAKYITIGSEYHVSGGVYFSINKANPSCYRYPDGAQYSTIPASYSNQCALEKERNDRDFDEVGGIWFYNTASNKFFKIIDKNRLISDAGLDQYPLLYSVAPIDSKRVIITTRHTVNSDERFTYYISEIGKEELTIINL